MKILTVFNDTKGATRFGEDKIEFQAGNIGVMPGLARNSSTETCKRFYWTEMNPGFSSGKDFAARRQVCVLLSGQIEIQTVDGEVRALAPGDVVRLEDTAYEAPGRSMRVLGDVAARVLVVQLE